MFHRIAAAARNLTTSAGRPRSGSRTPRVSRYQKHRAFLRSREHVAIDRLSPTRASADFDFRRWCLSGIRQIFRKTVEPARGRVLCKARQGFADTINRAAYGKERVVVRRRGKEIAAVVPIDDLRLLEELEDRIDLADARAALVETRKKGAKSLDAIQKEMGL